MNLDQGLIDQRRPCLIGTARRTWHPGGPPAPEPLDMWCELARAAADDVSVDRDVLSEVDEVGLVHCQSWAYDSPTGRLAERLGLVGVRATESILAGTSPQRLINAAAERMLLGGSEVALVVGGEALATLRAHARAGEAPGWSNQHPCPPALPVDLDEWYLPTEIAHGVLPAWLTFALLEQARWSSRGATRADRDQLGAVVGRLNSVAAGNPDAWFREPRTSQELTTPGSGNRLVATPYTKRMTAFLDVDMAAANLVVTKGVADRWGVPDDKRVYLRGWGFARESTHVGARTDLGESAAMRVATDRATGMAGVTIDEIDLFDLYSCFPSAVQFATDALGLRGDDHRPTSVTGGLPYHGGPSSNYMSHSISHLADRLRGRSGSVGMATGIGMHMTKHVASVWSATPGPVGPVPIRQEGQRAVGPSDTGEVALVDSAIGPGTVLSAAVIHHTDGSPSHAIAICGLPTGERCYARGDHPDTLDAVGDDAWSGMVAQITPADGRINQFHL